MPTIGGQWAGAIIDNSDVILGPIPFESVAEVDGGNPDSNGWTDLSNLTSLGSPAFCDLLGANDTSFLVDLSVASAFPLTGLIKEIQISITGSKSSGFAATAISGGLWVGAGYTGISKSFGTVDTFPLFKGYKRFGDISEWFTGDPDPIQMYDDIISGALKFRTIMSTNDPGIIMYLQDIQVKLTTRSVPDTPYVKGSLLTGMF